MTTHNENNARREQYQAPACSIVEIEAESLMAATEQRISRGGQDTDATKGTDGYSWAEAKGNTVNWDDAE